MYLLKNVHQLKAVLARYVSFTVFFSLMVAKLGLCPLPGEFGARAL